MYDGFIYETTCIINGMKYRGRHKRTGDPSDPDDSWYLGSPTNPQFEEDLQTYGIENFCRVILDPGPFADIYDCIEREVYRLVEVNAAINPLYYNRSNWGGIDDQLGDKNPMYGKRWKQSPETCLKKSIALKGRKQSEEHRRKNSESHIGLLIGDRNPMRNNPEAVKKVREALTGEGNPMYGKTGELSPLYGSKFTWMTDGVHNRRASDEELEYLKSLGYREGFTQVVKKTDESTRNRRLARSKIVYTRICKVCGREFQARSGNARYCDNCK